MEKTLGKAIKKRRLFMYLTIEDLAERLHVPVETVEGWENDILYPDIYSIPELAEELGLYISDLFKLEERGKIYTPSSLSTENKVMVIENKDHNGSKVKIPVNLLEVMLLKGGINSESSLNKLDWDRILKVAKSGVCGRISDGHIIIDIEEI